MADLKLKGLDKIYPNGVQAVFDFNLDIEDGEFIVLVGPSGCGKSTTLRMVAGLEEISNGVLEIDGKDVTNVAAKDRDIAMVFQNYALYGHKTVYDNMAFSLDLRGIDPDETYEKVMGAADILDLKTQLNKKPRQLSGGQRQRVAVGRTIVRNPKVFLFDEPLSNLDAKLRGSMRRELKLLHQRLGATMIYVTHDQIEALTLADRIVVMSDGRVQQVGKPIELYDKPANLFVASFIGLPPMNFIKMKMVDEKTLKSKSITWTLDENEQKLLKDYLGKVVILGVRPEDIREGGDMQLKVSINENLGWNTLVHGKIGNKRIVAKISKWLELKPDDTISVSFARDKVHYFDAETTNAIR
ncbi:MAG: sn-glycerol-3-phosphate ABC transporter ATP-binding protein UgpC [Oscillospiraceae bacterium]|nr:sn-glycerol-3-phosphate ABC transporter ATP-binding protein UgpC [Oscillospiraceae bacterium]MBP1556604.1 sn-glycerol-3-phosphate ABC transporter ATP-binding protein UgpC [Oscillospiraceae bacterium]